MRLENIWIVFRKEFLDVLRDRRTLISMVLLPIVIFPVLTVGLGSFAVGQMEKMQKRSSPIIIIGQQWAPELLNRLRKNPLLQVIAGVEDSTAALEMLRDHTVQAVVVLPAHFENNLFLGDGSFSAPEVEIWYDESYTESALVLDKVREEINNYRDLVVKRQLEARNLPSSLVEPFVVASRNQATKSQMAAAVLGMFLPYVVIVLVLAGSTYPAIDLTAGEKERGTMETLLVSPASRLELVLGKFLTTMLVGLITAFLAVLSLSYTFFQSGSLLSSGVEGELQFTFDPLAFVMVFILLLPVAALFASALIAIAINARSYKEAQSYIYPLMILVILPAIASIMPGVEADKRMALIPILNVSLTLRNALMGSYNLELIMMTFLSSIVYAAFGIFVAVKIFQKERVLLRI